MCNAGNANSAAYAHALADALITDFPPAAVLDTIATDSAALARHTGVYRDERTHGSAAVRFERGAIRFDGRELKPLRGGTFAAGGARLRFEAGTDGKTAAALIAQADGDTLRFVYEADKAWAPTAPQLAGFEGNYRSDEVGVTYTAKVVNDTLTLSPRAGVVTKLTPTYADAFDGDAAVWFTRDGKGRVTAMHFGQGRMWDLVLPRVR
jgi:hypothetical protein